MTDKAGDASLAPDLVVAISEQTGEAPIVLPLHGEDVAVSRRKIDTAIVKVEIVTRSREALVNEGLTHERVEIERVPVGRVVDSIPAVREEGDFTIIPIVEEVLVIEKRLVLKEEVRLRKVRVTEQHRETVVLREQEAVVTRRKIGV